MQISTGAKIVTGVIAGTAGIGSLGNFADSMNPHTGEGVISRTRDLISATFEGAIAAAAGYGFAKAHKYRDVLQHLNTLRKSSSPQVAHFKDELVKQYDSMDGVRTAGESRSATILKMKAELTKLNALATLIAKTAKSTLPKIVAELPKAPIHPVA